jgi:predicted phosphodiesterase
MKIKMRQLTFISDTHNRHKEIHPSHLDGGDVLIHTGDFSNRGTAGEIRDFFNWFKKQTQYTHRICIAGNHDRLAELNPEYFAELVPDNVIYLQDSGVTLGDLNFWGTPVTAEFCNWAFNKTGPELDKHFAYIPDDTHVLLTHGGPSGVLQTLENGLDVGMPQLAARIEDLKELEIAAFGHIHHSHRTTKNNGIIYVNSAICNESYLASNIPITVCV